MKKHCQLAPLRGNLLCQLMDLAERQALGGPVVSRSKHRFEGRADLPIDYSINALMSICSELVGCIRCHRPANAQWLLSNCPSCPPWIDLLYSHSEMRNQSPCTYALILQTMLPKPLHRPRYFSEIISIPLFSFPLSCIPTSNLSSTHILVANLADMEREDAPE